MYEVAGPRPLRVAESVHVVESSSRCYAAIVTEVKRRGAATVHFFLPLGARVPWPGVAHPYDPSGAEIGSIHRIEECHR